MITHIPTIQFTLKMETKEDCVAILKHWIENEVEFYSRTDDDFLLIFLRSCDFDVELSKTVMTNYYKNRRDIPKWWANRTTTDETMQNVIRKRIMRVLTNTNKEQDLVGISTFSNLDENSITFDDVCKFATILTEFIMRRSICQQNGVTWIVDFYDTKIWFISKSLNPQSLKKFVTSIFGGSPTKINKLIFINMPAIGLPLVKLMLFFLPKAFKSKVFVYGTEWPTLSDHVPLEMLPEEYGGEGGPLLKHDEAFMQAMTSFNSCLVSESIYGYP
ncbi:hypothetical protein CHUAL_001131 [Chamberlinius hualienensis]